MPMKYQERMRQAVLKISECLDFYSPSTVDQTIQGKIIRQMAESLNKVLPAQYEVPEYVHAVDETIQMMVATYKGKSWPNPAHFVDAWKKVEDRRAYHATDFEGEDIQGLWEICQLNWKNSRPITPNVNKPLFAARLLDAGSDPVKIYKSFSDLPIMLRLKIELTPEYQAWDLSNRTENFEVWCKMSGNPDKLNLNGYSEMIGAQDVQFGYHKSRQPFEDEHGSIESLTAEQIVRLSS